MKFRTIAGLLGLLLLVGFLLPPIIKLKKLALAIVVLIGIGMAAYEFYESLRGKEE
jgi:hypothetical protein